MNSDLLPGPSLVHGGLSRTLCVSVFLNEVS